LYKSEAVPTIPTGDSQNRSHPTQATSAAAPPPPSPPSPSPVRKANAASERSEAIAKQREEQTESVNPSRMIARLPNTSLNQPIGAEETNLVCRREIGSRTCDVSNCMMVWCRTDDSTSAPHLLRELKQFKHFHVDIIVYFDHIHNQHVHKRAPPPPPPHVRAPSRMIARATTTTTTYPKRLAMDSMYP
jgi:hypothetical protein